MPAFELDQDEVDLRVEAVAAHFDNINVAMERAMGEGDRVRVTNLSEQAEQCTTPFTRV